MSDVSTHERFQQQLDEWTEQQRQVRDDYRAAIAAREKAEHRAELTKRSAAQARWALKDAKAEVELLRRRLRDLKFNKPQGPN
jgi:hypothetical protein